MLKFNDIPVLGLGTWGRIGDEGLATISAALEMGFRHIDTAQSYDTETSVGRAVLGKRRAARRGVHHHQGGDGQSREQGFLELRGSFVTSPSTTSTSR